MTPHSQTSGRAAPGSPSLEPQNSGRQDAEPRELEPRELEPQVPGQHPLEAQGTTRPAGTPWVRRTAAVLSEVLSPFIVLAAVLGVVAWRTDPNWLLSAAVSAGLICGVPQVLSLVMTHRGLVSDRFIVHRHQRHVFYALSLASMVAGAVLVQLLPTGPDVRLVTLLAVATLLVVMVVNAWIKISMHALGGAIMAVAIPAAFPSWPVIVAAVLSWLGVTWSRVYLDRHQLIDVILGSILGGVVGAVFVILADGLPTPA